MNKQKQTISIPVVGVSPLLVIFAVLCMTVFALLGLSTVQADKGLSDVRTAAVSDYYAADCRAEEILARLRSGETVPGVSFNEGIYVYACPISDTQTLQVEVQRKGWKVLRWQAVSAASWQAKDSVSVWDGDTGPEDLER